MRLGFSGCNPRTVSPGVAAGPGRKSSPSGIFPGAPRCPPHGSCVRPPRWRCGVTPSLLCRCCVRVRCSRRRCRRRRAGCLSAPFRVAPPRSVPALWVLVWVVVRWVSPSRASPERLPGAPHVLPRWPNGPCPAPRGGQRAGRAAELLRSGASATLRVVSGAPAVSAAPTPTATTERHFVCPALEALWPLPRSPPSQSGSCPPLPGAAPRHRRRCRLRSALRRAQVHQKKKNVPKGKTDEANSNDWLFRVHN